MEKKDISILFITIAGNELGYGHLNRCLSLAGHASKRGCPISFLLFGDADASARVSCAGFECLLKPIIDLGAQLVEALPDYTNVADVAITDFSHQDIFPNLKAIHQILNAICSQIERVVIIDALGSQSIANKMSGMPIDILVAPYVGAKTPTNTSYRILKGPSYALLGLAYSDINERVIRHTAERILVSCGGSDPTNLTTLVLDGINQISRSLDVRVIVGPLFDKKIRAALNSLVLNFGSSIELVDSPDMLVEHMKWCDVAIATTGLIKYELAATATPAILISIDDVHDLVNRPFSAMGSVIDLGFNVTPEQVATNVSDLVDNYDLRVKLSMIGHKMIDGKGSERLVTEILRICHD